LVFVWELLFTVDDLGVFEKPPDLKSPVDDLLVVEELSDLVVPLDDLGVEKLPDLKLPPELRLLPPLLAYATV
jgi:hypothetical protein